MASFRQRGNKWQARITRGETIAQKSFLSKRDAERWARDIEIKIDRGEYDQPCPQAIDTEYKTLGQLLERYKLEVSDGHRSNTTKINIRTLIRTMGHLTTEDINARNVAQWRDKRLSKVKPASVAREINTLSAILNHARSEWEIPLINPIPNIKRPSEGRPRARRLEGNEEGILLAALQPNYAQLIRFAIETGMRRGEILGLDWENIDTKKRVAFLQRTKNGQSRSVPLSTKALVVLAEIAPPEKRTGKVFEIKPITLDKAWRRACKRTGITGLRVHDLRHEAVSRFFELGLNLMEVASISGHKSLSQLKRYTHLKAEDLALKLG